MARPKLPEGEAKRVPLNIRTTPATRARLEAAARSSGRSLAQELEYRLEQSLADERAGDSPTSMLLRGVGSAIRTFEVASGKTWTEDEETCRLAHATAARVLEAIMHPQHSNKLLRAGGAPLPTARDLGTESVALEHAIKALTAHAAALDAKADALTAEIGRTHQSG